MYSNIIITNKYSRNCAQLPITLLQQALPFTSAQDIHECHACRIVASNDKERHYLRILFLKRSMT